QRIAIVATHAFIRNRMFEPTFTISTILLHHPHDLIHKAVGWMLREVGNLDFEVEYQYLVRYYHKMPRTMLRYAIEKFDEDLRQKFLKGKILVAGD
ncbi:MAG: DNA alkylation repair protein, partial [Candidatus Cloacimonadaceae bacterium]|nr:DNA alkylation repair protein [Candidatus Cloacimonadaceae bacterium]